MSKVTIIVTSVLIAAIILVGSYFLFVQENEGNTNATNAISTTNENVNTANINTTANENTNVNAITSVIDTSDWVTYENEEYGFSFRYPDEWTLEVFEYDPAGSDVLSRGGNRVVVSDPDSGEMLMVCPDERGSGCIVSHEPHEITLETPTQVSGRGAVIRNYKIGEVVGCPECSRNLKTVKIVLDDMPSNWTNNEFILVPSADGTNNFAQQVLDTFQF